MFLVVLGLLLALLPLPAALAQETGRVTVNLGPPEVVQAGAAWSVDGGRTWRPSAGTLDLPAGSYAILFRAIPGWKQPQTHPLQISPRTVSTVEVRYGRLPSGGRLTVNLGPPGLVVQEGTWSTDGGITWLKSGQTAELPAGAYVVSFGQVGGWGRPKEIPVELDDGETVEITATYGSLIAGPSGLLRVSLRPSEAVKAGARWSVDAGANWFRHDNTIRLEPGKYRIIFQDLPGWVSPRPVETEVEKDKETREVVRYQEG